MELFILSFLVFALSALGLALAGLRGRGRAARASHSDQPTEAPYGCGIGCACVIAKRTSDDET
jgi:hypothetical protein